MIQVFSKEWFEKHQIKLLRFANSWIGKRVLSIHGDRSGLGRNKIENIGPNYIKWQEEDGKNVIEFRTTDRFGKYLYRRLRPFWEAIHLWDTVFANNWRPEFNLGFDTLDFYPDEDPESTSIDGTVYHQNGAGLSWATIVAAGGTGATTTGGAASGIAGFNATGTTDQWSNLFRTMCLFDTSTIGSGKHIVSATLSIYGYGKNDPASNTPNLTVYSANPASNTNLVGGDFDAVGSTAFSDTITYAGWSTSSYNVFTLNDDGIAAIAPEGISKFSIRNTNYDVAATQPTWGANNQTTLQGLLAGQGANDPKLTVEFYDIEDTGWKTATIAVRGQIAPNGDFGGGQDIVDDINTNDEVYAPIFDDEIPDFIGEETRLSLYIYNDKPPIDGDIDEGYEGGQQYASKPTSITLTTSNADHNVGGPTDLWGTTWSASDFSNSNFLLQVYGNAEFRLTDFDFGIPSNAIILGIEVLLRGYYIDDASTGTPRWVDSVQAKVTYAGGFSESSQTIQAKGDILQWGPWSETWEVDVSTTVTNEATVDAKARIEREEEYTTEAKANVLNTADQTIDAKARVETEGIAQIDAKANIFNTTTQVIDAKARISIIEEVNINAKGRIERTEQNTAQAKGNIRNTYDGSVDTKGNIRATQEATVTSKASVYKTTTQIIESKGNILNTIANEIQARARILRIESGDIDAKARVQTTTTQDIESKANIKNTVSVDVSGKANIKNTLDVDISAKANIFKTQEETVQAMANILNTIDQTVESKARIQKEGDKFITAKASVKNTIDTSINALARIRQEFQETIQAKSRIERTESNDVEAKGSILNTTSNNILAKANVRNTQTIVLTAKARVQKEEGQTIEAKANIRTTNPGSVDAGAYIVAFGVTKTIQAKARIAFLRIATIQAKSNILRLNSYTVDAKAFIQKLTVKEIITADEVVEAGYFPTEVIEYGELIQLVEESNYNRIGVGEITNAVPVTKSVIINKAVVHEVNSNVKASDVRINQSKVDDISTNPTDAEDQDDDSIDVIEL